MLQLSRLPFHPHGTHAYTFNNHLRAAVSLIHTYVLMNLFGGKGKEELLVTPILKSFILFQWRKYNLHSRYNPAVHFLLRLAALQSSASCLQLHVQVTYKSSPFSLLKTEFYTEMNAAKYLKLNDKPFNKYEEFAFAVYAECVLLRVYSPPCRAFFFG